MMELLRQTADNGSLVNKTLTGGSGQDQKTYQVKSMDDFFYKDPIDGSVSKKQVAYKVNAHCCRHPLPTGFCFLLSVPSQFLCTCTSKNPFNTVIRSKDETLYSRLL